MYVVGVPALFLWSNVLCLELINQMLLSHKLTKGVDSFAESRQYGYFQRVAQLTWVGTHQINELAGSANHSY